MKLPELSVSEYPYVARRWGIEPEQVRDALAEVVKHGELRVNSNGLPVFVQQYRPYMRRSVVLCGPQVVTVYARGTDAYRTRQRNKQKAA